MKMKKLLTTALPAMVLAICLLFTLGGAAFASAEPAADSAAAGGASAEFDGILNTAELFTDRDLKQTADLKDAVSYTVKSGEDIHITAEGVYVLSGSASDVTVYVEADDKDKVQLVLDGVNITNSSFPCIYAKNADKVFVTTSADSSLSVTGDFRKDGTVKTDGTIFSRTDLVMNGTAALLIDSSDNGVVCKDDLKITGGSFEITAHSKCLETNDSILIADGSLVLTAGSDALYTENDDDDTLGYVYIKGGELTIDAKDDGIHALSVVQIDGGTIDITAAEGMEATYCQVNDGVININAKDDGINGTAQSAGYKPTIEINGGTITIVMSSGDTDGIDCNGDIIVNGGTVDVTGGSTFDFDGEGQLNGGTVIVNGEQVTELPNQTFGMFGWGWGR